MIAEKFAPAALSAAATIDEIAASAGTTRTTFYLHFPSKAQLIQALIEDAKLKGEELIEQAKTAGEAVAAKTSRRKTAATPETPELH